MEYKVVTAEQQYLWDAEARLKKEVNSLLKDGWRLQGGVSVAVKVIGYSSYYTLVQALVRGEDKSEPQNDVQVTLV